MFTISREGAQDADRDGLLGANRSNSLAIARICNNGDRPIPRLHTRVEIVNTLLDRYRIAALAWFCVDADTCLSTARWLKNASTSTAPMSCGCRLP